jgi:hypothetical protein
MSRSGGSSGIKSGYPSGERLKTRTLCCPRHLVRAMLNALTERTKLCVALTSMFSSAHRSVVRSSRSRTASALYSDGYPIEVQIRTEWQHLWAEWFERLADQYGRGIRYGEPPISGNRWPDR